MERCQKELREKKKEIAALTLKFEKLHGMHKGDLVIQKEQIKQLDFFKKELLRKDSKCHELRQQITFCQTQEDTLASLNLYLTDLQNENRASKAQVDQLMKINFHSEHLENRRSESIRKEHLLKVASLENEIISLQQSLHELEIETKSKESSLKKLKSQIERLESEILETESLRKEKEESVASLEANVAQWTTDDQLEFTTRALQNCETGKQLEFLNKVEKNDHRTILELQIQNKELESELQNYRQMLHTQINLNEGLLCEREQMEREAKNLVQEAERLREAAHKRAHQERELSFLSTQSAFSEADVQAVQSDCDWNLITLKIIKADLSKSFFDGHAEPTMFYVVDFFEFESSISNAVASFSPIHNFRCQYRVDMSAFTLEFLQTGGFDVDLVQQAGNAFQIIGSCHIDVGILLEDHNSVRDSVVVHTDSGAAVGKLQYEICMLKQINDSSPTEV